MKIHNYIPPITIHPILIVFIIISIVTGTFVELFIILSIVFIHEFGHFAMATFFQWRIKRVMLWVFGGVMETEEHGGRPILEEVFVTIAGPIQHVLIYLLTFGFGYFSFIPEAIINQILFYNTVILLFNLLPIWPLDGGKLLFLCYCKFLPYRKAYDSIIIQSIIITVLIMIAQVILLPFSLSALLIMFFLLLENRLGWKQRYFVFIRFLIQRYESNHTIKYKQPIFVHSESSLMDVFIQFRRDISHSIFITNSNNEKLTMDEHQCLHNYFKNKHYEKTISEIIHLTS